MEGDGNYEDITTAVVVSDEAAHGFGPLRAALEAVRTNYKVRLWLAASSALLTNSSAGNCRHQKQGRRSPLAYNYIGRTIRFATG